MERNLVGQIAIITGAAEGIGFATAQRLARAGAAVALADINGAAAEAAAARLTTEEQARTLAVSCDVSAVASVEAMVAAVRAELGAPTILVNNAGIVGPTIELEQIEPEDWERTMAVNLRGVFLCCRAVLPGFKAQGYGRIINVASISGKEGNPRMAAYSSSKAAVIGLTKALAKEVAEQNIYVNAIAPAVIATRINENTAPEVLAYMLEKIPMKRVGQPEEVAALIHWLASDDCSFTTGQCLDISGGRATY